MTNRIINYTAFTVLTLLWLGFGAFILIKPEALNVIWEAFRSWPLVGQLIGGLLALPVVLGLWIWQTDWALSIRLVLVIGLAAVTIYTFIPRNTKQQVEPGMLAQG